MVVRKWPEKPEYEKSTEEVNPERVGNGRKGRSVKIHGNEDKIKGNKSRKSGNSKGRSETEFQSVENVRNAKKIANPMTKRAWNARKRRKEEEKRL